MQELRRGLSNKIQKRKKRRKKEVVKAPQVARKSSIPKNVALFCTPEYIIMDFLYQV